LDFWDLRGDLFLGILPAFSFLFLRLRELGDFFEERALELLTFAGTWQFLRRSGTRSS
jgi:hypothetical protein